MAAKALAFYGNRTDELDDDVKPASKSMIAFATTRMTIVSSVQQSMDLVASDTPSIVIASSGMATGGRVLHHLLATLPCAANTVLFVGFQAEGTRGRQLVDGSRLVRIKGRDVPVEARIEKIDSMSAHADAEEIMRWLGGFTRPPGVTYLVHGEPAALNALKTRIETGRRWPVRIAQYQERVEI
jgi:metallo-beta-lactamase family protein